VAGTGDLIAAAVVNDRCSVHGMPSFKRGVLLVYFYCYRKACFSRRVP
jgi:hypothetical protein